MVRCQHVETASVGEGEGLQPGFSQHGHIQVQNIMLQCFREDMDEAQRI